MEFIQALAEVDWVVYLERKQPFFLFDSCMKPYGSLLKEVTGFGFEHQLHSYAGDRGIFYRSGKEMKVADEYFLDLIKNNDERLRGWEEKGVEFNKAADKLIERYSSPDVPFAEDDLREVMPVWESVFLYSTIIPYRILSAVNSAIEKGEDKNNFKYVLDLYEPLRGTTKYPQFMEKIFPRAWHLLARVMGAKSDEVLSCLTVDEVKLFLENGVLPSETELEARKRGNVSWLNTKSGRTAIVNDLSILSKIGIHEQLEVVSEIKGSIAQKGLVRGIARVINNENDIGEFNDGDIIISINTSPSLMPVLIKSGGIVTDEGGIMCHAAIVSRELKKPCVIGTKIATKVIKNGDLVEVDANNGLVRIINN